jgi:hypothetical protein
VAFTLFTSFSRRVSGGFVAHFDTGGFMKRLLTLALGGAVAVALLGCHASIEPNDSTSGSSHTETKTTYNNDGTKTTKTETKTDKTY